MMLIIGPMEARPMSPKPSESSDLSCNTEAIPIPIAIITGTVIGPVVTLPASKEIA
jgi:hypothetical protein